MKTQLKRVGTATAPRERKEPLWKYIVLIAIAVAPLVLLLALPPIVQDPRYHDFADKRAFLGIPNFMDVVSNVAFLLVSALALGRSWPAGNDSSRRAWVWFFSSVGVVSVGSAYYHWHPTDATLFWDRLPMTFAFMALMVGLLSEFIDRRIERLMLLPALALGLLSVVYWHWFKDLRFYVWVQLMPLLTIAALMSLFRSAYSHSWLLLVSLACYVVAKIAEASDTALFTFTKGNLSGHSLKHLFAAACCLVVWEMLKRRRPLRFV